MALVSVLSIVPADPTYETGVRFLTDLSPTFQNTLHIPAYAVITLAYMGYCFCFPLPVGRVLLVCLLIVMPISVLNEVAQIYVPGRYGSLMDICLNLLGVLTGLGAGCFLENRKEKTVR